MDRYRLVGIHGAPRSGTTWLGELFNSQECVAYRYQPFFSYAFRGQIDERSSAAEIRRCFDDMFMTRDEFVLQRGAARLSRSAPHFEKALPTHLVYKEVRFHDLIEPLAAALPDAKFVGIVRDPVSVLRSWFAAPRDFKPEWSKQTEWRRATLKNAGLAENWYGYERWKQLALMFLSLAARNPDRFRLVRYEELVSDPRTVLSALFRFCDLQLGDQTARFIAESTTRDDGEPYGVFRRHRTAVPSQADLPAGMVDDIKHDVAGTPLEQFLAVDTV